MVKSLLISCLFLCFPSSLQAYETFEMVDAFRKIDNSSKMLTYYYEDVSEYERLLELRGGLPENALIGCRDALEVEITQDRHVFRKLDQTPLEPGRGAQYIFVMDEQGRIYATIFRSQVIHHSSILAGEAVAAAGELRVGQKGKLLGFNNLSGHYAISRISNEQMMQELRSRQVEVENLSVFTITRLPKQTPAKASASQGHLREDTGARTLRPLLRKPLWLSRL